MKNTWAEEGTDATFYAMGDYIIQNDMSDPANFAAAQKISGLGKLGGLLRCRMDLANGDWFSSIYFNNTRMYRALEFALALYHL
jgi:hypothetical protein